MYHLLHMCSDTSITISTFTTSNIGDLTSFHWELGWHLQVLSEKREIKGTTSLKKILATIEPIKLAVLRDMSQTDPISWLLFSHNNAVQAHFDHLHPRRIRCCQTSSR